MFKAPKDYILKTFISEFSGLLIMEHKAFQRVLTVVS